MTIFLGSEWNGRGPGDLTTVVLRGYAVDPYAIRAVYWYDPNNRTSGAAQMTWDPGAGDALSGWDWRMNWSLSATLPGGLKAHRGRRGEHQRPEPRWDILLPS